MEIQYIYSTQTIFSFAKRIGKTVYRGNKYLKMISWLDPIIFILFYAVVFFLFTFLNDYTDVFAFYEEHETVSRLKWVLVAISLLVGIYSIALRQYLIEKARITMTEQRLDNTVILLRLTDDGLYQQFVGGYTLTEYGCINKTYRLQDHLIILLNQAYFYAVPLTAFAEEEQAQQFERTLRERLAQS